MTTRGEEELIDAVTSALHPSIPAEAVLNVVDAVKKLNIAVFQGNVRHIRDAWWDGWWEDVSQFGVFAETIPARLEELDS